MAVQSNTRIVANLLHWYRGHARDLPWRRTTDPYAIWISEIMLQQTQVKTVIPYWQRWMSALPSVESLARTRMDRVLKLWEGLGYYSRARNLQKAAQMIVEQHDGVFPRTFPEVLALPGIGRYTAGAICSIAFDQPTPVLDGNVVRVLARLYAISDDPKSPRTNARLWQLAEALVGAADRSRINGERACADLNQALMELGARVCTAATPDCAACPIRKHCLGLARRCVHRLPRRVTKPPSTARRFVAVVLTRKDRFLVRRRPAGVVNANLWEFPNEELRSTDRVKDVLEQLAGSIPASRCLRIKHTITRYRITVDVFTAEAEDRSENQKGRWCTAKELDRLAFSSAHRKIVAWILAKRLECDRLAGALRLSGTCSRAESGSKLRALQTLRD